MKNHLSRSRHVGAHVCALVAWAVLFVNGEYPSFVRAAVTTSPALEPVRPLKKSVERRAQDHGAFLSLDRPSLPVVQDKNWARNPIDLFVLARLESRQLRPGGKADRATLLRRASFDLTGLPPGVDDIEHFVDEHQGLSWAALIDRLLERPEYGERYARHWLDVARYADSAGYELDNFYQHAWRYRDYVIRAFNADTPYDRFVHEQIAGDLLWPDDSSIRDATGFYTVGPLAEEGGIKRPRRLEYQRLTDAADTTGEAFLALTVGCARCHSHKFDPITHRDYYAFQAIFASSEIRDLPVAETRDKDAEAQRKGPRFRVLRNREIPVTTRLLGRGDLESPKGAVPAGLPHALPGGGDFRGGRDAASRSARVRLATWITSKENPLTARVIANRVWMWHFGQALVETPNDFGTQGALPTHPALLDYLACYLRENDWSLKTLHRLIMNSATYRMSSFTDKGRALADPDCRLLTRYPRRRLEAEAIWDNLLMTSGLLNRTRYGPSVFPPIDADILQAKKNAKWRPESDRHSWMRRGIYVVVHRSLTFPFFETFNLSNPILSCGRRDSTIVSPQALTLLNDPIAVEIAGAFADRLVLDCGEDRECLVRQAWLLAFGRPISDEKLNLTLAYLATAMSRLTRAGIESELQDADSSVDSSTDRVAWRSAVTELCLALINANEFIYID